MATPEIPQRQLRNDVGGVLRRVEAGETLRVTVRGRPVAKLSPLGERDRTVSRERFLAAIGGTLSRDQADALTRELKSTLSQTIDEL
jgi:prevent-host-death family protein